MDINKVKISSMQLSDLDEMKDILLEEFDDFWSYDVLKSELLDKNSYYLILRYENEIVSFGGFKKILDTADIMNLVTKKNKRNMGFGKLLVQNMIQSAKKLGCKELTLEVSEKNEAAIHLYQSFQFYAVGKRQKYYIASGNAAILMTLSI